MSNYKIQLGIQFDDKELKNINSKLNNLTDNTHRMRIDLDTTRIHKQFDHIEKRLKNLTGTKNGVNAAIPINTDFLERSLREVKEIIKSVKNSLGTLDDTNTKSLVVGINQIANALGKATNESTGLVKSLSDLAKKDFSVDIGINLGGSKNSPVKNNQEFGQFVKRTVFPQIEKQISGYADEIARQMSNGKKTKGDMNDIFKMLHIAEFEGNKGTGEKASRGSKNFALNAFGDYANSSASMTSRLESYLGFYAEIQKAAEIYGIDLSKIDAKFSQSSDDLIQKAFDIKNGLSQSTDEVEKIKNLFGSIDAEGLSGVLEPIKQDLNDIREFLNTLSQGFSVDKITKSFKEMSSVLETLTGNLNQFQELLGNTLVNTNTNIGNITRQVNQQTGKLISDSAEEAIKNVSSTGINKYFKVSEDDSDDFHREMDNLVKQWTNGKGNLVDVNIDTRTSYSEEEGKNIERLHQAQLVYNNDLGETARKTIAWRQIGTTINDEGVEVPLRGFVEVAGRYSKSLGQTTTETNNFVKQQKNAVSSLTDSMEKLNRAANDQNYNKPIKDTANIEKIRIKYEEVKKAIQEVENASFDTFDDARNSAKRAVSEFQSLISECRNAEAATSKFAKSQKILDNLDAGEYESQLLRMQDNLDKLTDANVKVQESVRQTEIAYKNLTNAALGDSDGVINEEKLIQAQKEYAQSIEKTNNLIRMQAREQKAAADAIKLDDDRDLFGANIDTWLKNNSAAAKKFGAQLLDLKNKVKTADRTELNHLIKEFKKIDKAADKLGLKMQSLPDRLKTQFQKYTAYLSIADVFMWVSQGLRDMFDQVVAIDSAMTELKKVTDETDAAYDKFLTNAAAKAKEIGTTIDGLVESTADFARLGYEFADAQGLAEVANIYAVVGDEIDSVETATKSLISTLTAFQNEMGNMSDSEFAMSIIDKMNEVSNNFAISSGGIGEALQRSASSMMAANNSLDETIALITAANTVVQDPTSVGTAFKTISMRIRGAKTEMEAAGLETEGMVESTAKLRSEILALSGIDIMIDNNTFKSTYQIMEELADKWQDLTDIQQAAITELIAGKIFCQSVQKCA